MSQGLCGGSRPGHFDGVLTVVLKLLNLVKPDVAIFGKKDYQQLRVIERMAEDLDLDVEIVGGEIVREEDGLALSSRNRYLSDSDRMLATRLSLGLNAALESYKLGESDVSRLLAAFHQVMEGVEAIELEYVEVRDAKSLEPLEGFLQKPAVMLTAAKLGKTRLIDNIELGDAASE